MGQEIRDTLTEKPFQNQTSPANLSTEDKNPKGIYNQEYEFERKMLYINCRKMS